MTRYVSHRKVVSTVMIAVKRLGFSIKPLRGVTVDGVKAYQLIDAESFHTLSNKPFTLVTAYNLAIRNELTQLTT